MATADTLFITVMFQKKTPHETFVVNSQREPRLMKPEDNLKRRPFPQPSRDVLILNPDLYPSVSSNMARKFHVFLELSKRENPSRFPKSHRAILNSSNFSGIFDYKPSSYWVPPGPRNPPEWWMDITKDFM